jgi:hypothetical protein
MSFESQEFRDALTLAARSFHDHAGDEEAAAERISTVLGWSRARARWFLSVNAEKLQQMADELRRQREERAGCAGDE